MLSGDLTICYTDEALPQVRLIVFVIVGWKAKWTAKSINGWINGLIIV